MTTSNTCYDLVNPVLPFIFFPKSGHKAFECYEIFISKHSELLLLIDCHSLRRCTLPFFHEHQNNDIENLRIIYNH